MKLILASFFFFTSTNLYCQEKKFSDYSFEELVKACDLQIKMPQGFREIPVTENSIHPYQYAIRDSTVEYEIRYYVRPYELFSKDDTIFYADKMTYGFFVTSILEVSGYILPNIPEVLVFDKQIIKSDCNADYGLFSFLRPVKEFGEFKYCKVLLIKKHKVGELTVFLLFNELDHENKVITGNFFGTIDFK
jgi:hypothetical protein